MLPKPCQKHGRRRRRGRRGHFGGGSERDAERSFSLPWPSDVQFGRPGLFFCKQKNPALYSFPYSNCICMIFFLVFLLSAAHKGSKRLFSSPLLWIVSFRSRHIRALRGKGGGSREEETTPTQSIPQSRSGRRDTKFLFFHRQMCCLLSPLPLPSDNQPTEGSPFPISFKPLFRPDILGHLCPSCSSEASRFLFPRRKYWALPDR